MSCAELGSERLAHRQAALVRLGGLPDSRGWAERIERGLVRISTVTRLEVGHSARSGPELRQGWREPPLASLPDEYLTPAIEDPAVDVQMLLADRAHHRAPSVPGILIAATAELADLVVLHDDKGYELITEITFQPLERLHGP